MLAVIALVTGALVLTAFDNFFPSFFSVITALWVLTDNIDFSSWSRHGVHQENNYISYYNKLSYTRTLPKKYTIKNQLLHYFKSVLISVNPRPK